jgi:dTMP kinase
VGVLAPALHVVGLARQPDAIVEHDRLERESEEFHARAAAGYRELAERFPDRIVVLDASRPAAELAEEVYGALRVRT